jgi:hypothetical protein
MTQLDIRPLAGEEDQPEALIKEAKQRHRRRVRWIAFGSALLALIIGVTVFAAGSGNGGSGPSRPGHAGGQHRSLPPNGSSPHAQPTTASAQPSPSHGVVAAPTTAPTTTAPVIRSAPVAGPQNLVATDADKADLLTAFVAYTNLPAIELAGTEPGSVFFAYLPSTNTYWAFARFLPTTSASQSTDVGLQDGANTGIFSQPAGGTWTMLAHASVPPCYSETVLPASVQALWGFTDSPGCSLPGH